MDETPGPTPEPEVLATWSARKIHPSVLLGVAGVFAAFMVLAFVLVGSGTAVKALALGAIGFLVPLVPGVLSRVEYRATPSGIDRRPAAPKSDAGFRPVFRWDEIERIVPGRHGFKYYRPLGRGGAWRRFWRAHLSDAWSGEVHLEAADRDRVMALVTDRTPGPD